MTTESPDLGEVGPIFAAGEVAGEIRLVLPTVVQYVHTSPMTSNRRDLSSSRKRTAPMKLTAQPRSSRTRSLSCLIITGEMEVAS
jgi:hypothetical protein